MDWSVDVSRGYWYANNYDSGDAWMSASENDRSGLCIRNRRGQSEDLLVLNTVPGNRELIHSDFRFSGELLWLRQIK